MAVYQLFKSSSLLQHGKKQNKKEMEQYRNCFDIATKSHLNWLNPYVSSGLGVWEPK